MNTGGSPLQIISFLYDDEGNLWFGTHGDGIHRLRKGVVRYVNIPEPRVSAEVWAVLAQGNVIWIGTRNSGIRKITAGEVERPMMPPKLSTMTVGALLEEPNGVMWIGGEFGLFKKFDNKIDEIKMPDGHSFVNAFAMLRDEHGTVWVGGEGLFKIVHEKVFKVEGMPSGISINYLLEDKKGGIWIGSDANGVGHIAEGKINFSSLESGLVSNTILCLYEDDEGGICAGTQGGGLCRLKDGRWGLVNEKNGLLDGYVDAIIGSDSGMIWMSTNRGLFGASEKAIIDVAEGRRTNLDGISIELRDGLQSTEFGGGLQNCSARANDGTLWFVSIKGLVGYNPRTVRRSTVAPPVNIESIEVDGRHQSPVDGLEVGPDLQTIRFEYAGLNYIVPTETIYRYYLEGFDKQWVNARTQREATYTNLSPGSYAFHVSAAAKEGIWNEKGATMHIVVLPLFWQTGVFRSFCFFLVAGIIYAFYRIRVWQMMKTEQKLRTGIDEAVANIKVLQGLIPICSNCKKIRNDRGYWDILEGYIQQHSEAKFSHGICPDCANLLYPDVFPLKKS